VDGLPERIGEQLGKHMGTVTNLPYGPGTPLEVSQTFTPLGIRFWDLTQNLPIDTPLVVTLTPANSSGPTLQAVRTGSGVYAFFGLPGLWAAEHPGPWGYGPARTLRYVVTVQDPSNTYLPAVLVYTLDQTGTLIVNGSPDTTPGARLAHLFSAASRNVPPGVGAIRADLVDDATGQPAAWAVVRVEIGGETETWTGIADEAGRVLVLVPYPVAQELQVGSPPGFGQGNIASQTWPVTIEVQYSPGQLGYPADVSGAGWPWTDTPSLRDILLKQQAATIWIDSATPAAQLMATLNFGQDLVLRSESGSPLSAGSTLMISQGGSPL
jgi:hypothetical protein